MAQDRLQLQRMELKYHISEHKALMIRDFVRPYLELDEYGIGKPNFSYAIHSLYLDSDDLALYRASFNGTKNRYKLRLRYYDDEPDSPVFFEIKRRMNDAILKQRGGVRRPAVPLLLAGHMPEREHLLSEQPKQLVALQRFCQLMLDIQAKPRAHVAYLREAWVSTHDNSIRVTMDREIQVAIEPTAKLLTTVEDSVPPFPGEVILEIKFTGRFPNWFSDLVRAFGLQREAASKYCNGLEELGLERLLALSRLNGHAAEWMCSLPEFQQRIHRPKEMSGAGVESYD